jgi:hypothetical protein
MANSAAIANSFRKELLLAEHALGTTVIRAGTTKDTLKAALFYATASLGATTTAYGTTGEVADASYTAGGVTVTNANEPNNTTATAFWTPSAAFTWTTFTSGGSFDAVLLYNSTQSDKAIAVFTFGASNITAGTFTLSMPTNDASTGLIRLA